MVNDERVIVLEESERSAAVVSRGTGQAVTESVAEQTPRLGARCRQHGGESGDAEGAMGGRQLVGQRKRTREAVKRLTDENTNISSGR